MKAVFDTSTLQAAWRGGVLGKLGSLFDEILVPQSVADETRYSRAKTPNGHKLVPDLDQLACTVRVVAYEDLRDAVQELALASWKATNPKRKAAPPPLVALYKGRFYAWQASAAHGSRETPGGPSSRVYDVPDLEVVVLARARNAHAIVDDKKAQLAASALKVTALNTRELLARLVAVGALDEDSATDALRKIEATGYKPTKRTLSSPA